MTGKKSSRILIASIFTLLLLGQANSQQEIKYTRIAVMPFENLTGDTDKNWLGTGISETVTTELGTIRGLILLERAQLAKVMGELRLSQTGLISEENAVQVGKMLSAKYLVMGSYMISGDEVLINARLVEVETSATKETCKVRGSFKKIFDLMDELAQKNLTWVNVTATPADIERMTTAPERNPQIFEYLSRAQDEYFRGRTDEAEKWIRKAIEIEPDNPDAIMLLGNIQERRGEYPVALNNYTRSAEIYKNKKDEKNYACSLHNIGTVHQSQSRYDEALRSYNQSLDISRRIGNEQGVASTLNNIGTVYHSQGRYDETLRFYNQSLEISRRIGDEPGVAQTLNNIGLVHYSQGRYDEALQYFNQSLEISRRIGDEPGVARTLNNIGMVHVSQGRYGDALMSFNQSLEIMKRIGNEQGVAGTLGNIGVVYQSQGRYDEALRYFSQCLEISRRIGNEAGVAMMLNNLGFTSVKQGRYNDALRYFNQCLEIMRRIGNEPEVATTLNNIGIVNSLQSRFSDARRAWEEAASIYEKLGLYQNAEGVRKLIRSLPR